MENLSHSRHPNKFSKKSNSNVNFTVFDEVYGASAKFEVTSLSPRAEDYREIFASFHASRASSIPLLDLQPVDDSDVFFDVRSSGFDYSEIFGGFDGPDYAVNYEELFFQSNDRCGVDSSEEEASWTPEETESLSELSDHSAKNSSLSNEDPYLSVEDSTEFSISYHKVNQKSKQDGSNGHMTQLHTVPEFTHVVTEITHLENAHDDHPSFKTNSDGNLELEFCNKNTGRQIMENMSHQPYGNSNRDTFGNDVRRQREYDGKSYHFNEMFVSVSDISLRTEPSHLPPPCRPPPVLSSDKGDLNTTSTSVSEEGIGDSSPPYLDVEVDATSSAAISAAAMKEAMMKAQARLRSAKELMARKKEGSQSLKKPESRNNVKGKGKTNGSDNSNFLSIQGASEMEESEMKQFLREEGQKLKMETMAVPSSTKELSTAARSPAEGEHGKAFLSTQVSSMSYEALQLKEATCDFELVKSEKSKKDLGHATQQKILVQNTGTYEAVEKKNMATPKTFELQVDKVKKVKDDCKLDESMNEFKIEHEGRREEVNILRSKASKPKDAQRLKGNEKKVNMTREVCEREQISEKNSKFGQQYIDTKKKLVEAYDQEKLENTVEVQKKEEKEKAGLILKENLNEHRLKEANQRMENENKVDESQRSEKRLTEASKQEMREKRLRESFQQGNNEKRIQKALEQEQKEERFNKVLEPNENEKKLKENYEMEENEKVKDVLDQVEKEKIQKQALQHKEKEKIQEEVLRQEENENRQKRAPMHEEDGKKHPEGCGRDEDEKRHKEVYGMEKIDERLREVYKQDHAIKSYKKDQERVDSKTRLKRASEPQETNNESKEVPEKEEVEKGVKHNLGNPVGEMKLQKQTSVRMGEESIGVIDEAIKVDDSMNLGETQRGCEHHGINGEVEATQESIAHENKRNIRTDAKYCERKAEVGEVGSVIVDESFKVSGMVRGNLEHEENQFSLKNSRWDTKVNKVDEAVTGMTHTQVKDIKSVVGPKEPEPQERKSANKWAEKRKTIKQAQVVTDQEENKSHFLSTLSEKEGIENRIKVEAAHREKLGAKGNNPKTVLHASNAFQERGRKEDVLNDTISFVEKERENITIKLEKDHEKERFRKMEEEREREREREKDRMAVDRATLEARERAFTESRERAERDAVERATTEFRQRALTEARERLEKACAEAREKSLSDKASMDARLRAERAAVERATAEVRERAFGKAAFEARERLERSVSDKFCTSSRNTGSRQNYCSSDLRDSRFQSMGANSVSRNPYSTVYGASTYDERTEGVEGESVQRSRARLERHQRTANRAAKALAEKNMRDLLAQREQAERDRLAETLAAEVKRWSSGKEGNLRALLSTLQYILGAGSGWQPIPLTEVITASAVKKAYRKATLCVHPDKLQQRGASIQHKYICEKVFDLLKEAWSRFNSEER